MVSEIKLLIGIWSFYPSMYKQCTYLVASVINLEICCYEKVTMFSRSVIWIVYYQILGVYNMTTYEYLQKKRTMHDVDFATNNLYLLDMTMPIIIHTVASKYWWFQR